LGDACLETRKNRFFFVVGGNDNGDALHDALSGTVVGKSIGQYTVPT